MCVASVARKRKTTLINAILKQVVPELGSELARGSGLLPSNYNENTAIVTEVKLSRTAENITTRLVSADSAPATFSEQAFDKTVLLGAAPEFSTADGYPKVRGPESLEW